MLKIELHQNIKLTTSEYLERNKAAWEEKVKYDILSDYYNVPAFISGQNALDQLEINGLGDIEGKKILHMQCYFGLEALSMTRMGAEVTGLDFCNNAIMQANRLREITGIKSNFICANVYDAAKVIEDKFDMIFSSYGSICWLPDLSKWTENIIRLLKPGGSFYIIDFHPLIISFNLLRNRTVRFSYFNNENPLKLKRNGTYADPDANISTVEYNWNHSISEIINSFVTRDMQLIELKEYPYIPLNAFPKLEREYDGYNHSKNDMIPLLFSLKVKK